MDEKRYFLTPSTIAQKQYEALRAFFVDGLSAKEVATQFGYTYRAFTSLVADFRKAHKDHPEEDLFFQMKRPGRKEMPHKPQLVRLVVALRKQYLSVPDIKVTLDGKGLQVSEKAIYLILKQEGFARLPRRAKQDTPALKMSTIPPEPSGRITFESGDVFRSNSIGLVCFWPYIAKYRLDTCIQESAYPSTQVISTFSSIMSFLALKLSNIARYSADDLWCMDRGPGFFASLNVLPKAGWFSSYSHRVTRDMNRAFLGRLHQVWNEHGLLGDTMNLDFTAIPYWGEAGHLEHNWSGTRRHSLSSMLAILAQDPDSGLIDYGDTDVLHKDHASVVLTFLDFYRQGTSGADLKFLVFDSKLTTYQNLAELDRQGIKFLTIRRRGKNIVEELKALPRSDWKKTRVVCAGQTTRTVYVYDRRIALKGYGNTIRQLAITGHGKIKPALILTNDFDLNAEVVIRKYARRWLVEKTIAEQIEFFHLNRLSSSIVIKVDFDLTMTILAHNLYRLLARDLERYAHFSDKRLYEKFILNSGELDVGNHTITVKLKKKRHLPTLLATMDGFAAQEYPWTGGKTLLFEGMSTS